MKINNQRCMVASRKGLNNASRRSAPHAVRGVGGRRPDKLPGAILLLIFPVILFLVGVVGCSQAAPEQPTPLVPTPTNTAAPVQVEGGLDEDNFITITTDAPSRLKDFEDIDEFGNVVGFDPDLIANLAAYAGLDYEFVVTSFDGLLESVANSEFDIAISALIIPEQPEEGLAYTIPYLEVGQVLVVRANEAQLESFKDIGIGIPIGAQRFSSGSATALSVAGVIDPDLQLYDTIPQALQALIDREVEGVIIDSDDALQFTGSYPQQLKIAGGTAQDGTAQDAWISHKSYGIAVNANNPSLLQLLNEAIEQAHNDGTIERLTRSWLIAKEPINAGESLIGTQADEIVIGIAGELTNLDPAEREPDLVGWEVKTNILSGLFRVDSNNNLVPLLAADFPAVSDDKLAYTVNLRSGLTFSEGNELTAEDVRFSILRAAGLGNFQVNRYLKDANGDGFADEDAVQVIDPLTVKFTLKEPAAYFPSVLATPPFFVISEQCYTGTTNPENSCPGIGPYTVTEWEQGLQMRLRANPLWPGQAPAFEKIQLRFYDNPDRMRRSFENSAIDVVWTGLDRSDGLALRENPNYTYWEGPSTFKSYLVFEQSEPPLSQARVREAIAHLVDRQALASEVFQDTRKALYSPVPSETPGHVDSEPERDLEVARSILTAAGYSPGRKLELTIWYVNDGRYTLLEEEYAQALEAQLEEIGLIEVTLEGAPWEVFRPQSLSCTYPAYLLGWPSSGQPAAFLDAMSWMEYFVTNTDRICSNFESSAMDALLEEAKQETNEAARLDLYRQIQELWASEFPTLDLTQEPRVALSQLTVDNLLIDATGLMHYDALTKTGGS